MKIKYCTIFKLVNIIICLLYLSIFNVNAATYNSVVAPHGNFVVDGSWNSAPGSNTCSPSGNDTYNILSGDSIWTTCTNLSFSGGITINVRSGAVFYIGGNGAVTGNVTLNIEPGGKVIINGDLALSGNSDIFVDGNLQVNGDVTGGGSYVFDCNGNAGSGTTTIMGSGCAVCTNGSTSCSTPLPITLLDFEVVYTSNTNSSLLNWQTTEEINNNYFIVERSLDGLTFDSVGTVYSNGQSNTLISYSYEDENSGIVGAVYYRLKQVDFNGASSYSSIISISIAFAEAMNITVYPNPTSTKDFNVSFSGIEGDILFVLYDVHGKELFSKAYTSESNGILTAKELHTDLVAGIYYIQASSNGQLLKKKLIVR